MTKSHAIPSLETLAMRAALDPKAFEERVAFIDPVVAEANRRAIPKEDYAEFFQICIDDLERQFPDAWRPDLAYALRTAIQRRETPKAVTIQ